MQQEHKDFIAIFMLFLASLGMLNTILTSSISEAQKYFAITIILIAGIIIYILVIVQYFRRLGRVWIEIAILK